MKFLTFEFEVITWLLLLNLFNLFNPTKLPSGVFRADGGPKAFEVSSGNFFVESDKLSGLFVGPIFGDKFKMAFDRLFTEVQFKMLHAPEMITILFLWDQDCQFGNSKGHVLTG